MKNQNKLDVNIDLVFIIDLLSDSERKKYQISQELIDYLALNGIKQKLAKITTKDDVTKTFEKLKEIAESGKSMILQIVSHGNNGGIGIKSTGNYLKWETFRNYLSEINHLSNNTLLVNMTTCAGLHGIKIVDENGSKYPFFGLIGYSEKLKISKGKKINKLFFKKLLENKNIEIAIEEIKKELNDSNLYAISSEGYKTIKKNIKK